MPTGTQAFLTDPSNNVGVIAPLGNVYTNEAFPILMASYHQNITALSGGTNLPNVPCGKVKLQNLSGNGVMWIGGVGQSAPYSGRGNELFDMSTVAGAGGETMYVNNANQISICASLSGQLISFMAYGNSTTTVIPPSTQGTAPNETFPVLSGTTPLANTTDNSQQTPIVFTFNIPMDPNNISGLYVVTSGQTNPSMLGHLGGTLTYFSGSTTATFQPNSGQLQLSGWYIPMADPSIDGYNGISLGVTASGPPATGAVSGNPFQVQGPPIVSGFSYLSGLTGTSGQPFTVIFSQQMLSGTINISGIYVLETGTSTPNISGTVSIIPTNTNQALFTFFSGVLATSTTYIPFINTNVEDQFGNPIPALFSGSPFTTASVFGPDTTPPIVSGSNPTSGATGVLVIPQPAIQIIMNKSVNSGLVTTNTVRIHDIQVSDTNILGTVSLQSDLVTIDWTPNSPLNNLDLHRMEISGIQSLAGTFMTPSSGITFTVEAPLQVSGITPASGASSVAVSPTIQISMDRSVLAGTINTNTVTIVSSGGGGVTGSVSLASDNVTITFTPNSPLAYLTPYTYEISGIVDINNQQFMTPFSGAVFNTITPSLTQVYNIASGGTTLSFGPVNNQNDILGAGEVITSNSAPMYGKIIRQAQFNICRVGNLTGTVICGIIKDNTTTPQTVLGSIPAASLSTSMTSYTFTNLSGTYALGVDDIIVVQYSGSTNSNYIHTQYQNGNSYTATQQIDYFGVNPTGWYTSSSNDGLNHASDVVATFWY